MKALNRSFQNCNLFRIGWTIIEKSRPEHDPKFTRLYDLLATGSSLWLHFQSKCKEYRGLPCGKFEVASSDSFRDIKKIISWRRRRTSTIGLSENAFAFRLKTRSAPIGWARRNAKSLNLKNVIHLKQPHASIEQPQSSAIAMTSIAYRIQPRSISVHEKRCCLLEFLC